MMLILYLIHFSYNLKFHLFLYRLAYYRCISRVILCNLLKTWDVLKIKTINWLHVSTPYASTVQGKISAELHELIICSGESFCVFLISLHSSTNGFTNGLVVVLLLCYKSLSGRSFWVATFHTWQYVKCNKTKKIGLNKSMW